MEFASPPAAASWIHQGSRVGFEVLFVETGRGGGRLRGHTAAREDDTLWSVGYDIELDDRWRTRSARIRSVAPSGPRGIAVVRSSDGTWLVDGVARPDLDGCVDVDLESSAVTNTLPVHRLDLEPGTTVDAPAVYVRADDLRVERLEQTYRLDSAGDVGAAFHYESPRFDYSAELRYDAAGLVLDYPGIAVRDR
jgi:hypothetical protein